MVDRPQAVPANSDAALLRADNLTGARGLTTLFSDLSFDLQAGTCLRVVGPNGSGKTTLLRILAGLGTAERGQILPFADRLSLRRSIFYIGHAVGLNLRMNPKENLLWWLALHGDEEFLATHSKVEREAICEDVLLQAGLFERQLLRCADLSAGQKRRAALARMFLPDGTLDRRSIWILDEPFTSLDKDFCLTVAERISKHQQNAGAVVLTTHEDMPGLNYITLNLSDYSG